MLMLILIILDEKRELLNDFLHYPKKHVINKICGNEFKKFLLELYDALKVSSHEKCFILSGKIKGKFKLI